MYAGESGITLAVVQLRRQKKARGKLSPRQLIVNDLCMRSLPSQQIILIGQIQ
jgi:hypothetical protein